MLLFIPFTSANNRATMMLVSTTLVLSISNMHVLFVCWGFCVGATAHVGNQAPSDFACMHFDDGVIFARKAVCSFIFLQSSHKAGSCTLLHELVTFDVPPAGRRHSAVSASIGSHHNCKHIDRGAVSCRAGCGGPTCTVPGAGAGAGAGAVGGRWSTRD